MRVAPDVWSRTLDIVQRCGAGRRECVVYWIAAAGSSCADEVAHPRHESTSGHYEIDPHWLEEFWTSLAASKRSVLAQVHTHGGEAFHSRTDDEFPLIHSPGFLSLVLPDFGFGDVSPRLFLARLGADGRFEEVPVEAGIENL